MEWLLFCIAIFTLPDSHNGEMTEEVRRDRRNHFIAAAVLFALAVALRIFYTIH
jgi:hypothetical protein